MANRRDYFFRQKVTEAELDVGFNELELADRNMMADVGLIGVVSGLVVSQHSPSADLTVDVSAPGIAYDQAGQRIAVSSLQNVNVAVDSNGVTTAVGTPGNEKKLSVFIQFDRLLSDPRTDGNGVTVYFVRAEHFKFIVAQGAEAGAGLSVPPALRSDALLLCDITRTNGVTTIVNAVISTARREDAFVVAGTPRSIRRGQAEQAISDLLGFYNNHAAGLADQHADTVITAVARAGASVSLTAGTAGSQLAELIGHLNTHINGGAGTHQATSINYAGGGAWFDGTTNPAATVEAQIDKIITDLSGTAGAAKIGTAAIGSEVAAGSVQSALIEIAAEWGRLSRTNTWSAEQTFSDGVEITGGAEPRLNVAGNATASGTVQGATVTATGTVSGAVVTTAEAGPRHANRTLLLGAAAGAGDWTFLPSVGGTASHWISPGSTQHVAFALPLALGDRIKEVRAYINDGTAEAVSMRLFKCSNTGGNTQVGATQTSAGDNTDQALAITGLTDTVEANEFFNIVVSSAATGATQRIYAVEVVYDRVA